MKRILFLMLAVSFSFEAFAGEIYSGKWGGIRKTSIEFVSKEPLRVRYCWKTHCSLHAPVGDETDMTFEWRKTDQHPSIVVKMKKVGDNYLGTHKRGDETVFSEATLRKY